jgi:transposase
MLYIGIDVHKKNLDVCVIDKSGEVIERCKLANEQNSVFQYFMAKDLPASVAIEPTHNWAMLYDLLEQIGMEVHVSHPRETELIGKSKVKTDKSDSYKLAALLRAGFLPEAYVPDAQGRELRRLVRGRASLVKVCTQMKNQIHAVLREKWISVPYSDLFGKAGREYLQTLDIESSYMLVIQSRLHILEHTEQRIALLDAEITRIAHVDKRAMLLTSIKGIAEYSAILILAEIGDISRFARPESLVRFAGLNPSEDSSGERTRRGRISKEGSRWLRWILVEAAEHAIKEESKIRNLYLRVFEKKGHNWAIVAAARELLVSIYFMLNRMEVYRPSGKRVVLTSEAR